MADPDHLKTLRELRDGWKGWQDQTGFDTRRTSTVKGALDAAINAMEAQGERGRCEAPGCTNPWTGTLRTRGSTIRLCDECGPEFNPTPGLADPSLFRQCEDSGHPPAGPTCYCGHREFPDPTPDPELAEAMERVTKTLDPSESCWLAPREDDLRTILKAVQEREQLREALLDYEADHSGNDNPDPCPCPLCATARRVLQTADSDG